MGNSQKSKSNESILKHKNIVMVGLEGTGKTTILQKIKTSQFVKTEEIALSSHSNYMVESVRYKNLCIKAWNQSKKWNNLTNFGLCENTHGIIFVIDSSDRIRMDNSIGSFWQTARRNFDMLIEEKYAQNAAILILCNKMDLNNAMSVNTISQKLELNSLRNRHFFIISCVATNRDDQGIKVGMEWLLDTVNNNQHCIEHETKSILLVSGYFRQCNDEYLLMSHIPVEIVKFVHLLFKNPDFDCINYKFYGEFQPKKDEKKVCNVPIILLMKFINRRNEQSDYIDDDEEFIKNIDFSKEYEEKWMAHYDFMRMIWCLFKFNDRRNGMNKIWKYSPYNTTFTYFWSQIIYFGMHKLANCDDPRRDFNYFLIVNPSLSNDFDTILNKYYSQKLRVKMEENEKEMILPDLMALPSMITHVKQMNFKVPIRSFQRFKETDAEFMRQFETKTFGHWEGHISFLRVIWCCLHLKDAVIKTKWKKFDECNYNETKTHFYILMMRYFVALYDRSIGNETDRSFDDFLQFCSSKYQCKIQHAEWWKTYYSEKLLQEYGKCKVMQPDLKKLPM